MSKRQATVTFNPRLRSSPAPEGWRHFALFRAACHEPVAILAGPRGLAPPHHVALTAVDGAVAILASPRGLAPQRFARMRAKHPDPLRSSPALEGWRHTCPGAGHVEVAEVAILASPEGLAPLASFFAGDVRDYLLRSSPAPKGWRHGRTATETEGRALVVAILASPEGLAPPTR